MHVKLGCVHIQKYQNSPVNIHLMDSDVNVHGYLPESGYSIQKKALLLVLETLYNEVKEMEIL